MYSTFEVRSSSVEIILDNVTMLHGQFWVDDSVVAFTILEMSNVTSLENGITCTNSALSFYAPDDAVLHISAAAVGIGPPRGMCCREITFQHGRYEISSGGLAVAGEWALDVNPQIETKTETKTETKVTTGRSSTVDSYEEPSCVSEIFIETGDFRFTGPTEAAMHASKISITRSLNATTDARRFFYQAGNVRPEGTSLIWIAYLGENEAEGFPFPCLHWGEFSTLRPVPTVLSLEVLASRPDGSTWWQQRIEPVEGQRGMLLLTSSGMYKIGMTTDPPSSCFYRPDQFNVVDCEVFIPMLSDCTTASVCPVFTTAFRPTDPGLSSAVIARTHVFGGTRGGLGVATSNPLQTPWEVDVTQWWIYLVVIVAACMFSAGVVLGICFYYRLARHAEPPYHNQEKEAACP
jgi:hypothetical protein